MLYSHGCSEDDKRDFHKELSEVMLNSALCNSNALDHIRQRGWSRQEGPSAEKCWWTGHALATRLMRERCNVVQSGKLSHLSCIEL